MIGKRRVTGYGVKIQAGLGAYKWAVGWDTIWSTRAEAEACAIRARRNDGWSARVVEILDEVAS